MYELIFEKITITKMAHLIEKCADLLGHRNHIGPHNGSILFPNITHCKWAYSTAISISNNSDDLFMYRLTLKFINESDAVLQNYDFF
jgi:hypothetical protein